jgi:antitoxin component YwqK of YwqJK toxin-antitoxin module
MEKHVEYFEGHKLKKSEGIIKNGLKEGLWLYYYPNGRIQKEIFYKNNKENGSWTMWHENGQKYIEQNKSDGLSDGKWVEYYENGSLKEIGVYINGDYHPKDFWDDNGVQLLINGSGKKIEKFGVSEIDVFEQHYINGKFIKEIRI